MSATFFDLGWLGRLGRLGCVHCSSGRSHKFDAINIYVSCTERCEVIARMNGGPSIWSMVVHWQFTVYSWTGAHFIEILRVFEPHLYVVLCLRPVAIRNPWILSSVMYLICWFLLLLLFVSRVNTVRLTVRASCVAAINSANMTHWRHNLAHISNSPNGVTHWLLN